MEAERSIWTFSFISKLDIVIILSQYQYLHNTADSYLQTLYLISENRFAN